LKAATTTNPGTSASRPLSAGPSQQVPSGIKSHQNIELLRKKISRNLNKGALYEGRSRSPGQLQLAVREYKSRKSEKSGPFK